MPLQTIDWLYELPLILERRGLGNYLVNQLGLESGPPALDEWAEMLRLMKSATRPLRIAVVGKYIELQDAYMSVREALLHACSAEMRKPEIEWLYSGDLVRGKGLDVIQSVDGIIVPGGFGERGVEGKVLAAKYARENKVPYLGLCLGMQVMCIEFARNVIGLEDANSTEFAVNTANPVIDLMQEQRGIEDMGGTMRLGLYPCQLAQDSHSGRAWNSVGEIQERHRHRFEFNNRYREAFAAHGMQFSGMSPDGRLVEIAELRDHPFMAGSQFHPEFLSRPNRPHPLFLSFVRAAKVHENRRSLPVANGRSTRDTSLEDRN